MNDLKFKKPEIKINDTVLIKGTGTREPSILIGFYYLEELTPAQKAMLYTVISINSEEITCCIKPKNKNKETWETFPIDSLILVKNQSLDWKKLNLTL